MMPALVAGADVMSLTITVAVEHRFPLLRGAANTGVVRLASSPPRLWPRIRHLRGRGLVGYWGMGMAFQR
jgi:hypothetical protein